MKKWDLNEVLMLVDCYNRIIGIKQCTASEAPYPPGKTKGIIRLADIGLNGMDSKTD